VKTTDVLKLLLIRGPLAVVIALLIAILALR
jgi:hypothetical protein